MIPAVKSLYRWEGKVQTANEAALILKTRSQLVDALKAKIRTIHPYECPCIVAWPIEAGDPAYLAWIAEETRRD